jgi:hypothetical protein
MSNLTESCVKTFLAREKAFLQTQQVTQKRNQQIVNQKSKTSVIINRIDRLKSTQVEPVEIVYSEMEQVASDNDTEWLVPIRLFNGRTNIQECFVWNCTSSCQPKVFLTQLLTDLNMQHDPSILQDFLKQMTEQIDLAPNILDSNLQDYKDGDLRFSINLCITKGTEQLRDTFQWDILHPNSPEEFATRYIQDLQLSPHWIPLVSFSIREQAMYRMKALVDCGYKFDGGWIQNSIVAGYFLSPIGSVDGPDEIPIRAPWAKKIELEPSIVEEATNIVFTQVMETDTRKSRRRKGIPDDDYFKIVA